MLRQAGIIADAKAVHFEYEWEVPARGGDGNGITVRTGLEDSPPTAVSVPLNAAATLRFVRLEAANVAMSSWPFGMVAGVQLAAVFQSPLVGLRFQVALPALALWSRPRARSRFNPRQAGNRSGLRAFMRSFYPPADVKVKTLRDGKPERPMEGGFVAGVADPGSLY